MHFSWAPPKGTLLLAIILAMSSFTYRRRVFLASVSTGFTSYIFAEVESSRGGKYKFGHYMITIADCRRRIEIEFGLGTARVRQQSLAKIDLLIDVLTKFRLALRRECKQVDRYDGVPIRKIKTSSRRSTKAKINSQSE